MLIGNRYELKEQIGAGGMGAVYRGLDTQTGETVAIKRLKEDAIAQDPGIVHRFEREADALRQLNHPNIIKVLATDEQDGQQFIVMEYMPSSLKDGMDSPLSIARVLSIALDLADALTRAHRLNIIHRDLKPANVLMAEDGTPRLTDFGVARMGALERVTGTGVAVGTLDYLSPEAINGQDADTRTDIWAFGVVLFEILSSRHPFGGENAGQILMSIMTQPPGDLEALRPDAPIALVDLVYRMLEKDRDSRISSARLVGAELEAILQALDTGTLSSTARREIVRPVVDVTFATPTPATNQIKHNLPAQTTPFVGREAELAELGKLIHDANRRLVTILAPGGMGKTRLALEVATKIALGSAGAKQTGSLHKSRYPNGVYFVPLAPLSAVENIVPAVAEALGFQFYSGGDPQQELLDYLREKHMLLLMDNFEHLMDGAFIVPEILQAAPGLKVLATSRERLNLSGESVFNLGGMDFPDWETPKDALEYSAVKLFMQGAERAQPGFELKAEDLTYVARICRMVQGMPLAILLAAAWVEMLPLSEVADEISRSLDFLETEMRDVPERHRSIRAVFDYSWNLLNEDKRAIFAKLSVFRGGFTREAAQAVADAGLKPLTTLVNKSLLRRNPDSGRYEIHELLRQYAEARLGEQPEVQRQVYDGHAVFYLEHVAKQGQPIWSPHEKKAIEAIEVEIENVRAAWQWAVDHDKLEAIDRSLEALQRFYEFRSWAKEGVERFEQLMTKLERAANADENMVLWRVRAYLAMLGVFVGKYDQSLQLARDSLAYFRQRGMKAEMMNPLNTLNYVSMMRGQYTEACQYAEEQTTLGYEFNDVAQISRGRASLGYALFLQGNVQEAKQIYQEVIAEYEAICPPYGLCALNNNLGEFLHTLREEEAAKELFQKSFNIAKEMGNRRNMAVTLANLANVTNNLGDNASTQRYLEESLSIYRDIGDQRGIAEVISRLGNLTFGNGDYAVTRRYLSEGEAAYRALGDRRGVANSLALLGFISILTGEWDESQRSHEEALAIRRELGNPEDMADSTAYLCMVAWNRGQYDEALRLADESLALLNGTDVARSSARSLVLVNKGIILNEKGDYEGAQQCGQDALNSVTLQGDRWGQSIALFVLGDNHYRTGAFEEAKADFGEGLRIAQEIVSMVWMMCHIEGFAMLLMREESTRIRAVELLAVVREHHSTMYYIRKRAADFLSKLQTQLQAETFRAAVERGKGLNEDHLKSLVTELLQE